MGVVEKVLGKITIKVGMAMIVVGVAAFVLTGMNEKTALIPAFFGIAVGACGYFANKMGKPPLIAAFVLSILGALGPLGRIIPQATKGELSIGPALIAQAIFILLCVALAAILVKGRLFKKTI